MSEADSPITLSKHITPQVAHRLFAEAREFTSGRAKYMSETSEIRIIARFHFHQSFVNHLNVVCSEIFYTLACEAQGVEK